VESTRPSKQSRVLKWALRHHLTRYATPLLLLTALRANAQSTGSDPWDNAVNVLKTAFTGTIATGLSLVAIVVGGLMFAYGEGQSKKTLAGNCLRRGHGHRRGEDFTLFPLVRPGSFVEIDSGQTRVEHGGWNNEFDRPIYFVELRDSYVCSWCEPREGKLLLIPYPQSRSQVREVRFPRDSEIVGRVTAVSMRIAG
jgi:type IV secretory pathway VirB2 component (pilin)